MTVFALAVLSPRAFVDAVIWQLPQPLPGSTHAYKYRLAYVVDEVCVVRFDNESSKGDHKHVNEIEVPFEFTGLEAMQVEFWVEVNARRK